MRSLICLLFCGVILLTSFSIESCTPHKWFIVNSEGILSYDRNKGTFELLWQNKAAAHSTDSGSVKVDSIIFKQ